MSDSEALRIVRLGLGTTIQDHGRNGWGHLGVPTAGAVDRRSHDVVNRLVGNPASAATLETLGGMVIEAVRPLIVARSSDRSRHTLGTGDRLAIEPEEGAVWAYLAVRGGVAAPPVLGSRSQDTLSGVGPPLLREGSTVGLGPDPGTAFAAEHAPGRLRSVSCLIWEGPQHDWFVDGSRRLSARPWTVSPKSSRVGVTLDAADFSRTARWEPQMSSVGLVPGAIQITPAGEPIIMLANHPTTGGYPVVAVVDPDDLPTVAQTPAGSRISFRPAPHP